MFARKPVADLTAGDYIVRIGNHPVGAVYRDREAAPAGRTVYGPRGGRYTVTDHGADTLVIVRTSNAAKNPVVDVGATATIEVME
jgi:hypothetical protein